MTSHQLHYLCQKKRFTMGLLSFHDERRILTSQTGTGYVNVTQRQETEEGDDRCVMDTFVYVCVSGITTHSG